MKVLITGGFGNLGWMCVQHALELGWEVKCFDLDTPENQQRARESSTVISELGDIRDTAKVSNFMQDVDAVIHLAAVLPPVTENQPELAREINLEASERLIEAAEQMEKAPVFLFPSSTSVFGPARSADSFKSAGDPVEGTDNYSTEKIILEERLQRSSLPWVIFRIGVSFDSRSLGADRETFRKMLSIKAANPLEYVHPADVALALCRAVASEEAVNKILLIGGGKSCQVTQNEFLNASFNAFGLRLPESVHGEESYYTHWMDTGESQRILDFQRHDFDDFKREMADKFRGVRIALLPIRWLLNWILPSVLKRL